MSGLVVGNIFPLSARACFRFDQEAGTCSPMRMTTHTGAFQQWTTSHRLRRSPHHKALVVHRLRGCAQCCVAARAEASADDGTAFADWLTWDVEVNVHVVGHVDRPPSRIVQSLRGVATPCIQCLRGYFGSHPGGNLRSSQGLYAVCVLRSLSSASAGCSLWTAASPR